MTPLFSIWYPVIILNECCNERFSTKLYLKIILYWFFYHIFTPQKYPQTSLIWQILPNAPYTTIKKQVLVPMGTNYFFYKTPTHPMSTTTEVFQKCMVLRPPLHICGTLRHLPGRQLPGELCCKTLLNTIHEFWKTFTTFSYTDIGLSQIHLHTYA